VMELVSRNMAIDITLGDKEKKEIANNVKVSCRAALSTPLSYPNGVEYFSFLA